MEYRARTRPMLRRAGLMAALTALLVPTVAFKRKGAKVMLVRSDKSTKKLLKVKLPKRLEKVLVVRNGVPAPTRLSVRILATRFGKRFTRASVSPIVGPEKPPAPPRPPA